MNTIRFGIIGGGLMGKEFASAAARWCHLVDAPARPKIISVCSGREATLDWFKDNVPTVEQMTTDYQQVLANRDVDAVYIAVPHHLHREMYVAAIEAGKHLFGEKPFGIDKPANDAILAAMNAQPNVLVRSSSQFPFFPAVQKIGAMILRNEFGMILELGTGFLHSSDLDPNKPINWKRQVEFNGEYGVMGDLGMHACHVPFRAGFVPRNVRAILSNIVTERPDAKGDRVPCTTWDNATLMISATDAASGSIFPWTLKTQRIAPGQKNTWELEILGTRASVRWSTVDPKRLEVLHYSPGGEQVWQHHQVGYEPAYKTISGGIFEFGFTDAILQMWAGFIYELAGREKGDTSVARASSTLNRFATCVTPEETALSHRLFTAALQSHQRDAVVAL
ncbi:MAG: Gfo/Idh/MocA family oxidoreductase [Gemmatimonadaceae bacterium]|nr:Gfo/Idh/MocA family oxidoreductase [Gemmatimonadaceae bacterium]